MPPPCVACFNGSAAFRAADGAESDSTASHLLWLESAQRCLWFDWDSPGGNLSLTSPEKHPSYVKLIIAMSNTLLPIMTEELV